MPIRKCEGWLGGANAPKFCLVLFGGFLVSCSGHSASVRAGLETSARELLTQHNGALVHDLLILLLKVGLGAAPAVAMAYYVVRRPNRWLLLWIPLLLCFIPVFVLQSLFCARACPNALHWILLLLISVGGVFLVRYPRLRFVIFAPALVLIVIPALNHGDWLYWHGERLIERCAANDGNRPAGLKSGLLGPVYFGVEPFPDGSWLLLAHRRSAGNLLNGIPLGPVLPDEFFGKSSDGTRPGSWWLRRDEGRFSFVKAASNVPDAHYWLTCQMNGEMWFPKGAACLSSITHDTATGDAVVRDLCKEGLNDEEFGITCSPARNSIFFKGFFASNLLELNAQTGEVRHQADTFWGGGGSLRARRSDGRIIVSAIPDLYVYSPDSQKVEHRIADGLLTIGLDLCPLDGAAAVTDFAGRLRVFSETAEGGYRFDWDIPLFAPRSVAFSPDCTHIAVASGDDRHVWVLDRATHQITATYSVGPSIRKLTFVSAHELAIVDACTVTSVIF